MARRSTQKMNRRNGYVTGNLAYDYDYLERERRRRAEREQREYAERRAREKAVRPEPRKKARKAVRRRERQSVSPILLLGCTAAAIMIVVLLMCYAQLTQISGDIVAMQKELSTLQDDHIALLSRYERTFDLAAIKEAAEAAGMAKPSASQITYVDLSAPDNVVLYQSERDNILNRAAASMKHNVAAIVEYFQ